MSFTTIEKGVCWRHGIYLSCPLSKLPLASLSTIIILCTLAQDCFICKLDIVATIAVWCLH